MSYKRDPNQIKKFAQKYVETGFNGKEAIKAISPELDNKALSVKKCRWLSSPEVIDEINSLVASLGITPEKSKNITIGRLVKIIIDESSKDSDAINAGMVLAKLDGRMKESGNTNNIVLNDLLGDLSTVKVNVSRNSQLPNDSIPNMQTSEIDVSVCNASTNDNIDGAGV